MSLKCLVVLIFLCAFIETSRASSLFSSLFGGGSSKENQLNSPLADLLNASKVENLVASTMGADDKNMQLIDVMLYFINQNINLFVNNSGGIFGKLESCRMMYVDELASLQASLSSNVTGCLPATLESNVITDAIQIIENLGNITLSDANITSCDLQLNGNPLQLLSYISCISDAANDLASNGNIAPTPDLITQLFSLPLNIMICLASKFGVIMSDIMKLSTKMLQCTLTS